MADKGLTISIGKILDDYSADMKELTFRCAKQAATETKRMLKETSPRRNGDYARSWSIKKGKDSYTVYNKIPSLTHLLEFGHITRNGTGRTFKATPAHPHIKDAEEFGTQRFIDLVQEEAGRL